MFNTKSLKLFSIAAFVFSFMQIFVADCSAGLLDGFVDSTMNPKCGPVIGAISSSIPRPSPADLESMRQLLDLKKKGPFQRAKFDKWHRAKIIYIREDTSMAQWKMEVLEQLFREAGADDLQIKELVHASKDEDQIPLIINISKRQIDTRMLYRLFGTQDEELEEPPQSLVDIAAEKFKKLSVPEQWVVRVFLGKDESWDIPSFVHESNRGKDELLYRVFQKLDTPFPTIFERSELLKLLEKEMKKASKNFEWFSDKIDVDEIRKNNRGKTEFHSMFDIEQEFKKKFAAYLSFQDLLEFARIAWYPWRTATASPPAPSTTPPTAFSAPPAISPLTPNSSDTSAVAGGNANNATTPLVIPDFGSLSSALPVIVEEDARKKFPALKLEAENLFAPDLSWDLYAKAGKKFSDLFLGISQRVQERDYVLRITRLATLMKASILLFSSPGTAKSKTADTLGNSLLLGGPNENEPSYKRLTLNQYITPDKIFGQPDWPLFLGPERIFRRKIETGTLDKHVVFLDEFFDPKPDIVDLLLELLAEGTVSEGDQIYHSNWELKIAATNYYISKVFDRYGSEKTKRMIDRFGWLAWIPGELEYVSSVDRMAMQRFADGKLPQLSRTDIELLRDLIPQVKISPSVFVEANILMHRMRWKTAAEEANSIIDAQTKDDGSIPFRSTKIYSPRTMDLGILALRTMIVDDYIESEGKRPLEVREEDLQRLRQFVTMNGPSNDFIRKIQTRTHDPLERYQQALILREREIFDEQLALLRKEIQDSNFSTIWKSFSESSLTDEERKIALLRIVEATDQVIHNVIRNDEMNGHIVAAYRTRESAIKELAKIENTPY